MKVVKPTARTLILVCVGAASFQAVASAPASLLPAISGFSRMGVAYEEARGRFWSGALSGVEIFGIELGDVEYEVAPLSLLRGRISLKFRLSGGSLVGAGRARLSPFGRIGVRDARLQFDLGARDRHVFLGEPLKGNIRADVKKMVFTDAGCIEADARLTTTVLAAQTKHLESRAVDLRGGGHCDGRDLAVSLVGDGDDGAISVSLRLTPSMTYSLSASVTPSRPELSTALQAIGFAKRDGELTFGTEGTIRAHGS